MIALLQLAVLVVARELDSDAANTSVDLERRLQGKSSAAGQASSLLQQGFEAAQTAQDGLSAAQCLSRVDLRAPWCEIAGQLGAHWDVCEVVWAVLMNYGACTELGDADCDVAAAACTAANSTSNCAANETHPWGPLLQPAAAACFEVP